MGSNLPPPSPSHLLRSHSSPVNALYISQDNERIYSGDGSGTVLITSTRTLRAITKWNAHTEGILGIEEWDQNIITHARDNKLHLWTRIEEPPASMRLGGTAALVDLPVPTLLYSLDVNSLNFCRFSLLRLSSQSTSVNDGESSSATERALVALPNLVESGAADIWALPSCERLHAAIGQQLNKMDPSPTEEFKGRNTYGIIMSLHLYSTTVATEDIGGSSSSLPLWPTKELRLLCAYENGSVVLHKYTRRDKMKSVEGAGWEIIWNVRLHIESVMAMRVSRTNNIALTVSADHIVGRYELNDESADPQASCIKHRTKHPGNGCIAIHDHGKVCAVGGWDGKIRLYSTKSLKPLGTLRYHKVACQALEFARSLDCMGRVGAVGVEGQGKGGNKDEDEDDIDERDRVARSRWLIGGGKDHRVSIWELMDFERKGSQKKQNPRPRVEGDSKGVGDSEKVEDAKAG
ncbi:hypothetical protein AMATHDRAFT_188211 [Amanita thiersii Skay4041]|uniref:ASTRA-associated protein 1 n=1 Tax=Amanita thiersii Skay4041 TaxID=703135 RepID=A0A2A9NQ23_9AGAR|nr:hypothetical protein AMATHDRAFT_188211 [Amanita thiersii Skay4041]